MLSFVNFDAKISFYYRQIYREMKATAEQSRSPTLYQHHVIGRLGSQCGLANAGQPLPTGEGARTKRPGRAGVYEQLWVWSFSPRYMF